MKTPFECVDPSVGQELWRLQQPDLDPALRATLEAHLAACHACRLMVRLDAKAQELARAGRLDSLDAGPAVRARHPLLGHARSPWAAALPLAASLVAMLALPPRPITQEQTARGPDLVRFTRPVEGEVVSTRRPELRWTPIPAASGYAVELRDREGRPVWTGTSTVPELRVPEEAALMPGREYRALLSVRPADLAPLAPASVGFRRDSFGSMVLHRVRWAHPLLQAAAAVSLALLLLASLTGARRRKTVAETGR